MRIRFVVLTAALLGGCAIGSSPAGMRHGVLTDAQGHTLYVFRKDLPGNSVCVDACAQKWPPFLARPDAKAGLGFSTISRGNGVWQWAYRGQPLYFFAQDAAPGDMKGDNVGAVWFVVRPEVSNSSATKSNVGY